MIRNTRDHELTRTLTNAHDKQVHNDSRKSTFDLVATQQIWLLGLALLPVKLTGETARSPGGHSYNEVLPLMLARYCGPGLLGLGVTALIAGFMSGMPQCERVTTVWNLRYLQGR